MIVLYFGYVLFNLEITIKFFFAKRGFYYIIYEKGDRMNRRRRKVKSKGIFFVLIVVIALLGFLSYIMSSSKELNTVESFIKDCIFGVQKVLYKPFSGFSTNFTDFTDLMDVKKENRILKSNVDRVEALEAENIELKRQLKKLKEELSVEHVLTDYDYLNATVISRNSMYWYNYLTIDKGSHNGIKKGMVVINSTGLIGKVSRVSTFSSDVKLITTNDTNNKISVTIMNGDNKVTGLINGYVYEEGILNVEGISNTESVSVGDLVYTSGLGGVFPSGILIGKVDDITTDVYDLAKIIKVKPSAKFEDINFVTVLKRDDEK